MRNLVRRLLSSPLLALGVLSSSLSLARVPDERGFFPEEVIVELRADIRSIAVASPHLFWTEDPKGSRPGGVYRADVETKKVEALWEGGAAAEVTLSGDGLYFLKDGSRVLSRLPLPPAKSTPTPQETPSPTPQPPAPQPAPGVTEVLTGRAVSDQLGLKFGGVFQQIAAHGSLYLAFMPLGECRDGQLGAVIALDPAATVPRVLARGCPEALTATETQVYWIERDRDAAPKKDAEPAQRLVRVGVRGGVIEVVARGLFEGAPAVTTDAVYYVDRAPKARGVYRWDLAKKTAKRILPRVGRLHVDLDNLYLEDRDAEAVYTFEPNGKGLTVAIQAPRLERVSIDLSEYTWVQCSLEGCAITSNAFGRLDRLLEKLPDFDLDP